MKYDMGGELILKHNPTTDTLICPIWEETCLDGGYGRRSNDDMIDRFVMLIFKH